MSHFGGDPEDIESEEHAVRPVHGQMYRELDNTVVSVDSVFRMFLRTSIKWNKSWYRANINQNPYYTRGLTAHGIIDHIYRNVELSRYFTIGDQFEITGIVGCTNPDARADFNVTNCNCVMRSRVEDEIGILFSSFGVPMPRWYFSAEDDITPYQKKVFVLCEGLDREKMQKELKYKSFHCIAFESHFPQSDVDKRHMEVEEVVDEVGYREKAGMGYRAHRGQIVKMDAAYPTTRRFPVMAYGEVLTSAEVDEYLFPKDQDPSNFFKYFIPLTKNLVYFVSERERYLAKGRSIQELVQLELRCPDPVVDCLPVTGVFDYAIPGSEAESFIRTVVGQELHFTMYFSPEGHNTTEFIGIVDSTEITEDNRVVVKLKFSDKSGLGLIHANCIRKRNYGAVVMERFNPASYNLMLRLLGNEAAALLDRSYIEARGARDGMEKILQMIVCYYRENPEVDETTAVEEIAAPGISKMNQPGQLMATRAIFVEKRPLVCVEGPWGTGKTLSIVSIVYRWVKENPGKLYMICAQSNLIVDHITAVFSKVQRTLEARGDNSVRICRSYASEKTAEKGDRSARPYAPWMLSQDPDERETEEMKEIAEKIQERRKELEDMRVSLEDRCMKKVKGLKLAIMKYLSQLIHRVYKQKLRAMWMVKLNPNIILSTTNHALVFHYGVEFWDEKCMLDKLAATYLLLQEALEKQDEEDEESEFEFEDSEDEEEERRESEVKMQRETGKSARELMEQKTGEAPRVEDRVEVEFNDLVCRHYHGIICDEAGQLLQHVAICLCLLLDKEDPNVQMVLLGDRFQLGPRTMVCSGGQAETLLERSILETLVDRKICAFVQLKHTFRSHPQIVEHLKTDVYGDKLDLVMMAQPKEREILIRTPVFSRLLPTVAGEKIPVIFFHYDSLEEMGAGLSYMNRDEAHIALIVLEHLFYKNHISLSKILVLTMYESQHREFRRLLKLKKYRIVREGHANEVDIRNVDGSQGQENDIVLVLTTRSNYNRKIGFLGDKHRANVALSRAKHGLIVFGNADTLDGDEFWRGLVDKYRNDGCAYFVQVSENLRNAEAFGVQKCGIGPSPVFFLSA